MDVQGKSYLFIFIFWKPRFQHFPFLENPGLLWTPVDWFLLVPCYSNMFVFVIFNMCTICFLHLWICLQWIVFTFLGLCSSPQPYLIVFTYVFSVPYSYLIPVLQTISIYVSCICSTTSELRLLYPHVLTHPLLCLSLSLHSSLCSLDSRNSRVQNSHAPLHSKIQDPWGIPQGTGQYPESTLVTRIRCLFVLLIISF